MLLGYLTLLILGFAGNVIVAAALRAGGGSTWLICSEIVALVAAIIAGAVTARVAREKPLAHAGALGLTVFTVTVIASAIAPAHQNAIFPAWYPYIAAALSGVGAFIGGALVAGRKADRSGDEE